MFLISVVENPIATRVRVSCVGGLLCATNSGGRRKRLTRVNTASGASHGPSCIGALSRRGGLEQKGEGARRAALRLSPLLATRAIHRSWTGLPAAMEVSGRRG